MVYVDLNVRATARVSAGELQRRTWRQMHGLRDCVRQCGLRGRREAQAGDGAAGAAAVCAEGQGQAHEEGQVLHGCARQRPAAEGRGQEGATEAAQAHHAQAGGGGGRAEAGGRLGSDVVQGYDVIAAEAATPKVFQFLCEQADIDLITFDVTNRLPFQIKRPLIAAAIKRDIHFEITYTPCLGDTAGRRYFFSNASNLVRLTGGKNLVFSSGATRDILLRSPYDVLNVGLLSGLKYGQALDAISTSCLAVLEHADKRRGITGGVQVEATEDVAME
ncbi:hypothetical protein ON010_g7435 [Phytophthora cinnamomi]|nr:hypothetical protein ON010_g7435 [Phytophthora cinnamomi]